MNTTEQQTYRSRGLEVAAYGKLGISGYRQCTEWWISFELECHWKYANIRSKLTDERMDGQFKGCTSTWRIKVIQMATKDTN